MLKSLKVRLPIGYVIAISAYLAAALSPYRLRIIDEKDWLLAQSDLLMFGLPILMLIAVCTAFGRRAGQDYLMSLPISDDIDVFETVTDAEAYFEPV